MAKILVVEDDEFFGMALKNTILTAGHEVLLTENGKQAVEALKTQNFDCVISDIQMPVMGGLELLNWIRVHKPTPFIIMTGFADNMDTRNAIQNGAVNFILKPFSEQDVCGAVSLVLAQRLSAKQELDPLALGYCRIPKGILFSQGYMNFNVYSKKDGGLVKIASKGETLNAKSIVKTDSVEFYTERESLAVLIPINLMMTKAVLGNQTVDAKKKIDFMRHMTELLQEKIKFEGLDKEAFKQSQEYLECTMHHIDALTVFALLISLNESGDALSINSLGVTCLALMIADKIGWAPAEMFKVTVAGFFHDIGKLALKPHIYKQPRPLLSLAEKTRLDDHPRLGRDLLIKTKLFSAEISTIVFQHHEDNCGTGYPEELVREQIHPIARLLHLADTFCKHTLRGPDSLSMATEKAIELMKQDPGLDDEYLIALKGLVAAPNE